VKLSQVVGLRCEVSSVLAPILFDSLLSLCDGNISCTSYKLNAKLCFSSDGLLPSFLRESEDHSLPRHCLKGAFASFPHFTLHTDVIQAKADRSS